MSEFNDKQLDKLLKAAEWPAADERAVQRLCEQWQTLNEATEVEADEDTIATIKTRSGIVNSPRPVSSIPKWLIALACLLLIGAFSWLAYQYVEVSTPNSGDAIAGQKSNPQKEPPLGNTDKVTEPQDQSNLVQNETRQPAAKQELITQNDFFAAISRVQKRRRNLVDAKTPKSVLDRGVDQLATNSQGIRFNPSPRKRHRQKPGRKTNIQMARLFHPEAAWMSNIKTEQISAWLGKSKMSAMAVQVVVGGLDNSMVSLRQNKKITAKQLAEYRSTRRAWEDLAWQFASSSESTNRLSATRFAIAVSSRRSLARIQSTARNPLLRDNAVRAICRFGSTENIQATLTQVTTQQRLQNQLLTALLQKNDRPSGLLFLEYMKDPKTSGIALQIANSTDQLPTAVWLESIARLDETRWDAALAVANVCDKRVTEGLINLAMEPTTSSTALIALIKSSCSDAQQFIAFAETDQQMTGSLMMARRRMKQLNLFESNNLESPQITQGLVP